jgi:streptogramin lyase
MFPAEITGGPDGNLWFIENYCRKIGRITMSGVITEFPIPFSPAAYPNGITSTDGNLWFG